MVDRLTLDVDVGNTRIKWRTWLGDRFARGYSDHASIPTATWPNEQISRIRIGSVASPARNAAIAQALDARYGVTAEFATTVASVGDVKCGYVDPGTMGVDRWLAVLAARKLTDGAYVVADLGTAATIDCVDATHTHHGGFIAPGTYLMTQALLQNTARIRVSFEDIGKQRLAPAKTTASAVRNGVLTMLVEFVAGSYRAFQREVGDDVVLLLCGGDAQLVSQRLELPHRIEPDLVLDGLAVALP